MVDLSTAEAEQQLGSLVRRAVTGHERVTITEHGEPAAVLLNAEDLADLEEAAALADYRSRQAAGDVRTITHREARARLRLPAADTA
jgi:prevent-host-death family protein